MDVLPLAGVLSGSAGVAMRLIACFQEILRHRGVHLTMLGAALSQALEALEAALVSSTDAVECVMQVGVDW